MARTQRSLILRTLSDYGLFKSVSTLIYVSKFSGTYIWLILPGVIVMTTQILALGLRKIRQPKVIAEVIGGILLGALYRFIKLRRS